MIGGSVVGSGPGSGSGGGVMIGGRAGIIGCGIEPIKVPISALDSSRSNNNDRFIAQLPGT